MKKILCGIFLLIALNACVTRVEKHGYMFDLSNPEMLQEGITSKERVVKIMGSPTITANLDNEDAWIYYAENVERFLFFKPKIISRDVLVLRFDKANTIKELKKVSLSDEDKNLDFLTEYTAVDSHKVGFIKSFFSNVGQVKPQ